MKILLIQSYLGGREPAVFPVGLACLKASLDGHDVRVFDTNISSDPFRELQAMIREFGPDIVGISLRNIDSTNKRTVVFYYAYLGQALDSVKSCSAAKIVIGGSGFSMFAAEIMNLEPRIDFGIYLEGETVFPALLENLDAPEKVPSVYYRKNGEVVFTGTTPPCDLNGLKMADCGIVPLSSYKERDALGIETKRGCALGCIYCIYGFLNGKQYRLKDPALVVDEIEQMVEKCGARRFMFLDSVFNFPKAHSEAICREIIRRGIKVKWSAWFSEATITGDFLELVAEAGCDSIMLSPDALSDPVLKTLGKNFNRKRVLEAYRLLRKSNRFEVSYNFFKTPPGQTIDNFLSIIFFCLKARWQMGRRVHFEFNSLRIEPHTRLFEIALREGVINGSETLLFPKYFVNRKTRFIGTFFDLLLTARRK
jgi:anaerobic magnesium-protoporphyrin IX monomethyl ester cyclase